MKFTEDFIIHNLYFSVILLASIVFFDVLIRFKSPLHLKLYFSLLVICIWVANFYSFIANGPDQFVLQILICKGISGISLIQVFTFLYFPKYKKAANAYSIFTIVYLMLLSYYSLNNESIIPKINIITSAMDQREFDFNLPFFGNTLSYLYLFSSNAILAIYIYTILFRYSFENVYFRKIQHWTISLFFFIVFILMGFIISFFSTRNNSAFHYMSIGGSIYLLMIILYRPNFINKNGYKISFGQVFNRNSINEIKPEIFDNLFFSNFYFRNKEASISDFANVIGFSKELIFKYVYQNYSMSFDELVNKNRIDYFVEIIKDPKFKNYTVEALALEVGFSSRQRFYQPFKRYHGGNPSDLIDIFND